MRLMGRTIPLFEFLDAQAPRQPYPSCHGPIVLGPSRKRYQTSAPLRSDISEILRAWHVALAAAASEKADLYACAVALAMESLDRYTAVQDLIDVYCSPDNALQARVLALCDEREVHLEPWIVMGSACALQFRQLMEKAIS
jgi:hypothetical protein